MRITANPAPSANLVQKTIRLTDYNSGIGPLRLAKPSQGSLLQDFSRRVAASEASTENILYTTGYGIHRSYEFPVRAPALMLPVLHVLEEMKRIGLEPARYLVYQATGFIVHANNLDPDLAYQSSQRLESYLRGYVQRYHRSIADYVSFEFGSEYTEDLARSIENIASHVRSDTHLLLNAEHLLKKTSEYERQQSNGKGSADVYTAANALYSGVNEDYPFQDKISDHTEMIIPVGGNPEKPFFAFTSLMADMRSSARKVIPFLTALGSRTMYYPSREAGDPMTVEQFAEAASHPLKDGPLRSDIQAMIADGATAEGLREIFPSTI